MEREEFDERRLQGGGRTLYQSANHDGRLKKGRHSTYNNPVPARQPHQEGAPKQIKFAVTYCSGEDPEFPASELNTHSPQTRGWQSPPFCAYPQEIGLEFLHGEMEISQLQILSHESKIATKIDVFVGHGNTYETCTFKRLGHLSLEDNERSDFAARELKSVYIGKHGNFLKLCIHKCHLNRHNIYNQAGIIAINVLGSEAASRQREQMSNMLPSSQKGSKYVPPPQKGVPPLEDLAFDMNFDQETANTMRQLAQAKENAVEREDFELAKELKHAQDQLKHMGVKMAGLENAKRAAVQREDYDEAAAVKKEIEAMRAEIHNITGHLLGGGGMTRSLSNNNYNHNHNNSEMSRFPPAIAQPQFAAGNSDNYMNNNNNNINNNNNNINSSREPSEPLHLPQISQPEYNHNNFHSPAISEDERPLPVLQKSPGAKHSARSQHQSATSPLGGFGGGGGGGLVDDQNQLENETPATDPKIIEQALGQVPGYEDLPEAESLPVGMGAETQPLVDVYGEYLVRCVYSRQVKLRSAALTALEMGMDTYDPNDPKTFNAFAHICKMSTTDKIANVCIQGLKVLEATTSKATNLRKQDLHALEPIMPHIVERLGNNTSRIRAASAQFLLHAARLKTIGPHFTAASILRQTRQGKTLLWRQLLGRLKLIAEMIHEFGMKDEVGLGLESVMEFVSANNALSHPHAEVREIAKELVMQAYSHVGEAIVPYLSELRPKQMEEYQAGFDQINAGHGGKPLAIGSGRKKEKESGKKSARSRNVNSPGAASSSASPHVNRPSSRRSDRSTSEREQPSSARKGEKDVNININVVQQNSPNAHVDNGLEDDDEDHVEPFTCQFCARHDETFTEEVLDMHYWKECPMLTSCAQCEQVIEVSLLNDHLLNECENKEFHKQCPRCHEAIAYQFFDQHVKRGTCLVAKSPDKANRCPLCHQDIAAGAAGWRKHLLGGRGCPKNPRTLSLQ